MDAHTLTTKFLTFFTSNSHKEVESSSVVPYNDPTLLFTNSGMVQFKQLFSSTSVKEKRLTSAQNCIRAGGKHNDLDDVGKDSYHHTFFVMLGNWSFGDYFKEEAVEFAWEFLVNVLKLDVSKIYVTYYSPNNCIEQGNDNNNCINNGSNNECQTNNNEHNNSSEGADLETAKTWSKYLPRERILPFGPKDNFWEMGDSGPCGPCTEIHYNLTNRDDVSHLVNQDDPNVIEIWNIVFIQYYRNLDGSLSELSNKCIDTGMGLERVLRIINKVGSNYLTDGFVDIIKGIEHFIIQSGCHLIDSNDANNVEIEEPEKSNEIDEPEKNDETKDFEKIKKNEEPEKIDEINENPEKNNEIEKPEKNDEINEKPEKNGEFNENPEKNDEINENPEKNEKINEIKNPEINEEPEKNEKIYEFNNDEKINNVEKINNLCSESEQSEEIVKNTENFIKETFKLYKDSYNPSSKSYKTDMAIRVIADHSRTISICLKDGITFSSDGRGYVLRRILRRAIKYANELGLKNKMKDIVQIASSSLKIEKNVDLDAVEKEERLFTDTLIKGKRILLNKIRNNYIDPKDVYLLYDTYGFPFDLTKIICEEKGIYVSEEEFNKIKEGMRSRKKDEKDEFMDYRGIEKLNKFEMTDDSFKYVKNGVEGTLLCVFDGNDIVYDYDFVKNKNTCSGQLNNNCLSNDSESNNNNSDQLHSNKLNDEELNDQNVKNKLNRESVKGRVKAINDIEEIKKISVRDKIKIYEQLTENVKNISLTNSNNLDSINNKKDIIINSKKETKNNSDGLRIDEKSIYGILLNKTSFYTESGGQVSDRGIIKLTPLLKNESALNAIKNESNENKSALNDKGDKEINEKEKVEEIIFEVTDTKRYENHIIHIGHFKKGNTPKEEGITLRNIKYKSITSYDEIKRSRTKANHTATHLLNHKLRQMFKSQQRGSLVDDKKLRFDFSLERSLKLEELIEIESFVNNLIKKNLPVVTELKRYDQIENITQLEGERYPEVVRVVSVEDVSGELCGGTHVGFTGEIGGFKIMSESGVAKNVRRLVCVTSTHYSLYDDNIQSGDYVQSGDYIQSDKEIHNNNISNNEVTNDEVKNEGLIEKMQREERERSEKQNKKNEYKSVVNENTKKIKDQIKEYKNHINESNEQINELNDQINELNTNSAMRRFKVKYFNYEITGNIDQNVGKLVNQLAVLLEKEKIDGMVYLTKEDKEIYFAFRGDKALERGHEFVNEFLESGSVNGKEKCANGKGLLK